MATTLTRERATTDGIADPPEDEGSCVLDERGTDRAYRVVDDADPLSREKLAARGRGEAVRTDLTPLDPDGLDRTATRIRPDVPATGGGQR